MEAEEAKKFYFPAELQGDDSEALQMDQIEELLSSDTQRYLQLIYEAQAEIGHRILTYFIPEIMSFESIEALTSHVAVVYCGGDEFKKMIRGKFT